LRRHELRQRVIQALYQVDVGKAEIDTAIISVLDADLTSGWTETKPSTDSDYEYLVRVVNGTRSALPTLDKLLEENVQGWSMDRIARVELNILRLALFELLYEVDVDVATVVDEAVELSKDFSTEESGKFVNGVLARILPLVTAMRTSPQCL